MGTTLGNLHLYTRGGQYPDELISLRHMVLCLSDGWVSILDRAFQTDVLHKEARRISKAVAAPMLSFFLFDDDHITLGLWRDGRRIGEYTDYPTSSLKGVSAFGQSLDLNGEEMARFRHILRCADARLKAELLEELFGVALVIDTDLLEVGQESFVRHKSRELFDAYWAEQSRMNNIRNKTKAVLIQEIYAKLVCLGGNILLSYPDEHGIHHRDKAMPYVLENGVLIPLLGQDIYVNIHETILTNGHQATVLDPLYKPAKGKEAPPLAVQYALGGSRTRQFALPDHVRQFTCMLADGSIIAQQVENIKMHGWGRPWLMRIATDGSIQWRITLDGGQFDGEAFPHEGNIYVTTRKLHTGITLYRVDLMGKILCQRHFPQALGMEFRHLEQGRLLCVVREAEPQPENRWSVMILDEDFSTRSAFDLPHGIWPVIHSHFGGGVLDAREKSLYFAALESKVVRVDLDEQKCCMEHLPDLCSVDCMDQSGLLYCRQNNSAVCVLDGDLHLVSRHRLKGNVYCLKSAGTGVYAVTSAGDAAMWGEPEKCIVRIYRFEQHAGG